MVGYMASVDYHRPRSCWRIRYTIFGKRKPIYAPSRESANAIQGTLTDLEIATKTRIASAQDIGEWIDAGYITMGEARDLWPGLKESLRRLGTDATTDYVAILQHFESRAIRESKAKDATRRTHLNTMSRANRVVDWIRPRFPMLPDFRVADAQRYKDAMESEFAPWTVYHRMTCLRILLDCACDLEMIQSNPVRQVRLGQPKTSTPRRVCSAEEARQLLKASLKYREWIKGGLPTLVRHGLYAGLRTEEMCWSDWPWLDTHRRVLRVQRTKCAVTGETWIPKDEELRELDVKADYVDYMNAERARLEEGQFIIRGGREGRPLDPSTPQKVFARMIKEEKMDETITIYSLRHTYATELLRESDLKTVQVRLGHSDIRTTEKYLRALDAEDHPTDRLPY